MNEIKVSIIEFSEFFTKGDYRRSIGGEFKGLIFVDESADGGLHVSFYSDYSYRIFRDLAGRIVEAEEKRLLIAGKTTTAEKYIEHLRNSKATACSVLAGQGIWMSVAIKRAIVQKPEKAGILASALKSPFYVGLDSGFHEWVIPLRDKDAIAFFETVLDLDYDVGDYLVFGPKYHLAAGVVERVLDRVRGCQTQQVSLAAQSSLVQSDLFGEV